MSFESDLDEIFDTAIDVDGTTHFDESETLRDAIMRIYYLACEKECKECIRACAETDELTREQADEFAAQGEMT